MSDILCIYYSRTGHTRRAVKEIAEALGAEITAITNVVSLIESLHLNSETINTWKLGVERALKQYISDGTKTKDKCPSCGQETMAYQNGCLTCMSCGYSKCG